MYTFMLGYGGLLMLQKCNYFKWSLWFEKYCNDSWKILELITKLVPSRYNIATKSSFILFCLLVLTVECRFQTFGFVNHKN